MNNPYVNAVNQLKKVAEILKLDKPTLDKLSVPERFVEVNFPVEMDDGTVKMFKGFRSQHNSALGPYKGGLRFSTEVCEEEVKALSMWMSWKCAIADIPYGGGKGGVVVDTKELSEKELENLSRAFVRSIADCIGPDKDVPAPDMYTTPEIMDWMVEEYMKVKGKRSKVEGLATFTGKSVENGGSEGRTEATGQGGVYCLQRLAEKEGLKPEETTVAVQGAGNVGYYFAKLASELGFKVVTLSDSKGGIYNENGIDIDAVMKCKEENGSFEKCEGVKQISNEELLTLGVDVLVPAAIENVITEKNAKDIKAKYIIEMANGPVTPEADEILKGKGIVSVPDVLANAGGVTVSYFEWVQNKSNEKWSKEDVLAKLKDKMIPAFDQVWEAMQSHKVDMRMAAYVMAVEKIVTAYS